MTTLKQTINEAQQYLKEELLPKVIEGFKHAFCVFIETLWKCLREEVIESAKKSLVLIKTIWESAEIKEKKKAILEIIMLKIKLPIVLRPFRGLIKNLISNKIDNILNELIDKGFKAIG